eukprot:11351934-Prorocentrum_lima.AAC.1
MESPATNHDDGERPFNPDAEHRVQPRRRKARQKKADRARTHALQRAADASTRSRPGERP